MGIIALSHGPARAASLPESSNTSSQTRHETSKPEHTSPAQGQPLGEKREIQDQTGHSIILPPGVITRYADLWFAHNETLIMLDGADHIVATVNKPSSVPWMFYVAPALYKAYQVRGGLPNVEELLLAQTQLVFVSSSSRFISSVLRKVGLNVVETGFTKVKELKESVKLTADVIGTPHAYNVAQHYLDWLDFTLASVTQRLEKRPDRKRLKILHIHSLSPLTIDGRHTLIDTWIKLAGGVNAADISGNMKPVTLEQIAYWDPDVIILENHAGKIDTKNLQLPWHWLRAVRFNRVYNNPAGLFNWDRYSLEFPLQVVWAARTFYPELFEGQDFKKIMAGFYRTFFDVDFTDTQIELILKAQPPPVSR
ncbi:ABC transporter substrate-binding protein [Entomobacter blattae]|uniref:Periplasmic binding protein n=1 Tax=Entomobacter blattae TaxID=2762277 RepID=A0A7H1NQ34_9PROT|nr:ABC transporter substrate-binding protein [Entomobacter blattae]QNT77894.1 Periplasmic binding protein [Entomobacter blattae]